MLMWQRHWQALASCSTATSRSTKTHSPRRSSSALKHEVSHCVASSPAGRPYSHCCCCWQWWGSHWRVCVICLESLCQTRLFISSCCLQETWQIGLHSVGISWQNATSVGLSILLKICFVWESILRFALTSTLRTFSTIQLFIFNDVTECKALDLNFVKVQCRVFCYLVYLIHHWYQCAHECVHSETTKSTN